MATLWNHQETVVLSALFENYVTGDDGAVECYGVNWKSQTFTVGGTGHTVSSVKIKAYRVGSPGTLTVSIRATDANGHPTGSDLTSGTIDANTFTTNTAGAWYEITVSSYSLSANTKYAIVVRATGGDASNLVYWRTDSSEPTYTDGNLERSTDGGSSWEATAYDAMFEVWGDSTTYCLLKETGADGASYVQNQASMAAGYRLLQKFVYALTGKAGQAISGTVTYYFYAYTNSITGAVHGNVEILIRKADGTVRTTLVAKESSGNTPNFDNVEFVTVSGSSTIPSYTVVDETDYLEFDFYAHVTTGQSGRYAYIRYDYSGYASGDQMRIENIVFGAPPVVPKKPIMKMDLGPHPRSRLLFAPTLFLGAKGASSSSPPSDPWEGWFMDEV
jgi:hypothetical protein